MSNVNINKKEWLELVFEGKNKAYGAYQLRQESGSTTTKAFFSALGILSGIAAIPFVLSSFTDKPISNEPEFPIDPLIRPIDFTPVKPLVTPPKPIEKSGTKKTPLSLTNPVIKPATEVKPVDQTVTTPTGNTTPTQNTGNENPDGNVSNGNPNTNNVIPTPEIDKPKGPYSPAMLDKSPMFPGGLDEFRREIANRFQAPEMEEESGTVKIYVMFVVEKDGSLTNIVIPRSAGEDLDKEAIRVLKSIRTKWEPGIFKGEPVRTQYSVPIVIKVN